jgi:TonB family protein
MHLTLLESHRSVFQPAECALVSLLAHAGVVWLAVSATAGGTQLPTDEREARVFFLLPPDRVDVRARQMERLQWGLLGQDLENGRLQVGLGESRPFETPAGGVRGSRHRAGARGQLPFGPVPEFVPDSVFSVLQVDQIVERYATSAAPIYPPDLLKIGAEGQVLASYVVDTMGMVDTTSIRIEQSDDPRFTASVRDALRLMRFRPARRQGNKVRQLVEQGFRFHIVPPAQMAKQVSLLQPLSPRSRPHPGAAGPTRTAPGQA